MSRIISIVVCSVLYFGAFAQGSRFEAKLNREAILIGEQLQLTLRLEAAAADSLELPILEDTIIS